MSGKTSRGMTWARIVIVLILVSLMAWCTTNNRRMAQSAPLRMELQSIFLEQGLIDNNNERSNLADVAKKAGTARMNRLLYDVAGNASLESFTDLFLFNRQFKKTWLLMKKKKHKDELSWCGWHS